MPVTDSVRRTSLGAGTTIIIRKRIRPIQSKPILDLKNNEIKWTVQVSGEKFLGFFIDKQMGKDTI